jgi:hypothetical protein
MWESNGYGAKRKLMREIREKRRKKASSEAASPMQWVAQT